MKKALATLALLAVAGLSQAATINWSGAAVDMANDPLTSGTAYLVYCGADNTIDATWDESSQAWVMDDDIVVAYASYGTSTSTAGEFSGSTKVATPAGSMYYVIVTDAGAPGVVLPTVTGSYYGTSGTLEEKKGGATDVNAMPFGGQIADTEITPVPEPTTVALALVGVAAVALRRKFMKK